MSGKSRCWQTAVRVKRQGITQLMPEIRHKRNLRIRAEVIGRFGGIRDWYVVEFGLDRSVCCR
jgi:hypothetical protein